MNAASLISGFSSHLFWDTDKSKLDLNRNKKYIIKQVLDYGLINDWRILKQIYGLETITETAKFLRDLDKKTLSFLASVSNEPLNSFRCYTYQQSAPRHWDF